MNNVSARVWWGGLAVLCALLAAATVGLTHWLTLDPCHLCIFQRLLLMLMASMALLAVLPRLWRWIGGGAFALLAAAGMATATYQSWLQLQPAGSVTCLGAEMGPIEQLVEWLGRLAPGLFMPSGFCEDRELEILGLSLANWALALFAAAILVALWLLRGEWRAASA